MDSLGLRGFDMAKSTNPVLQAAIMEIVHNQLRDSTPPEVRVMPDRSLAAGPPPEQAEQLIACVLSSTIFHILKRGQPYSESRYVSALRKPPQWPWDEA